MQTAFAMQCKPQERNAHRGACAIKTLFTKLTVTFRHLEE